MNKSDYDKYYKKGGTYVIPVEIFNELCDELERLSFNYEQALEDLDKKDKEINRLKRQIKIKDEWCSAIWKVGANYDGYGDDLKGLRELVDELIDYSNKARTCDDKSVAYVSWEGEKEIKSNILMERIESDK